MDKMANLRESRKDFRIAIEALRTEKARMDGIISPRSLGTIRTVLKVWDRWLSCDIDAILDETNEATP